MPDPPLIPPPPPPPPAEAKPVSRYHRLRGKSVLEASFDMYRDDNADVSETRSEPRRSKSLSQMRSAKGQGSREPGPGQLGDVAARAFSELELGAGVGDENNGGNGTYVSDLQKPVPPLPTPSRFPMSPKDINTTLSARSSPIATAKKSLRGPQPFARIDPRLLKQLNNKRIVAVQSKERPSSPSPSPRQLPSRQPEPRVPTASDNTGDEDVWLAREVARLEAETDRIIEEQKKLDLARLQAQLASTPSRPKPRRLILDNILFFSKKKSAASAPSSPAPVATQPPTPQSAPPAFIALSWDPKPPSLELSLQLSDTDDDGDNFDATVKRCGTGRRNNIDQDDAMAALMERGDIGINLQDAPSSASNAGERRVTVRCLTATINLPVNASTNAEDIAYSTANLISHKIEPSSCAVVECFGVLGLERRLRRYEPVKDVMNSWDRDTENTLLVLSGESPADTMNLHLSSVPKTDEPPMGFTLQLYHSSQPRKWNKRWVTLMDNGQIFTSKYLESKSTDKDSIALCHLSDFDIYTPTESEKSRHLKPPKKHCYAIKSQQKTNVFTNGQNFIHYFATEDVNQARRFYDLVHGWRSWYLVNKSLDLNKKDGTPMSPVASAEPARNPNSIARRGTQRTVRTSTDHKPYTIGEFQPLLDMSHFDKPIEEFGKGQHSIMTTTANPSTPVEASPKSKTLRKTRTAPPTVPQSAPVASEFLAGGLLGATYEQRKLASDGVGSATIVRKIEGPFTEGPSLLNQAASTTSPKSKSKSEATSWFPSALEHSARGRGAEAQPRRPSAPETSSSSTRRGPPQPQPLVNLTNTFGESRQGRRPGRGVKAPDGAPLIDFASGGTMQSAPMPSRSTSRASSAGGPQISSGARPRSRSSASASGVSRSGSRWHVQPEDQPPVPPLPNRSVQRRATNALAPEVGSKEPLINRAR